MSRDIIGRDLSRRIHAAEAAIDLALIEIAGLAAALPEARVKAGLSATTAQAAFTGVAASLSSLTESRAHLGETHRALAALARRMGLHGVAVGPADKPEDRPPLDGTKGVQPNVVNEA